MKYGMGRINTTYLTSFLSAGRYPLTIRVAALELCNLSKKWEEQHWHWNTDTWSLKIVKKMISIWRLPHWPNNISVVTIHIKGRGEYLQPFLWEENQMCPSLCSLLQRMSVRPELTPTIICMENIYLWGQMTYCGINSLSPLLINKANIHMEIIACITSFVFHWIRPSHFSLRRESKHLPPESFIIACLYRTNHVPAALSADRSQILTPKSLQMK